ncbi:DUF4258 domain-containing protein [Paraflavitalea soli]|uniref:DUF4258 domain-containing protein n=1 Tax=Paraflavitalea soli TaxID=2315862 RepID=A0A3B7MLZ3_9BACT|nr:DUF4258 domain-containing protein [Paraflavitalea soli]AXY73976.1 DUF4258 domain-containing protein [Paraflavitalea soli]
MKKTRGPVSVALIVLAIAVGIVLNNNRSREKESEKPRQEQESRKDRTDPGPREPGRATDPPSDKPVRENRFDRRVGKLIYTKHARCRMGCRHIDESEVKEILEQGVINERKSEPAGRPDPKYALEGRTHDGQQVRIVFAPTSRGMLVITVIDLDTDWTCDCK